MRKISRLYSGGGEGSEGKWMPGLKLRGCRHNLLGNEERSCCKRGGYGKSSRARRSGRGSDAVTVQLWSKRSSPRFLQWTRKTKSQRGNERKSRRRQRPPARRPNLQAARCSLGCGNRPCRQLFCSLACFSSTSQPASPPATPADNLAAATSSKRRATSFLPESSV